MKDKNSPDSPGGIPSAAKRGMKPGWTRRTIVLHEETYERIKRAAYWERKEIKIAVQEAFEEYLKDKKTDIIP